MRRLFFLLFFFLPGFPLAAGDAVTVSNGWIATPVIGSNAVGYVALSATENDRLLGGSSDCCRAVEIHQHVRDGDIMRMRRVKEGMALPAGETATLEPGGHHLMLIGLQRPLAAGDTVDITLRFEHAPEQTVPLTVGNPQPAPTSDDSSHPHDHHH